MGIIDAFAPAGAFPVCRLVFFLQLKPRNVRPTFNRQTFFFFVRGPLDLETTQCKAYKFFLVPGVEAINLHGDYIERIGVTYNHHWLQR